MNIIELKEKVNETREILKINGAFELLEYCTIEAVIKDSLMFECTIEETLQDLIWESWGEDC